MRLYGLIGYPLVHSFSQEWFSQKFRENGITDAEYINFPIHDIRQLPFLLKNPSLLGFNVTAPHKRAVIEYLDAVDTVASAIGAVNCVVREEGMWKGYNTDWLGFKISLEEFLGGNRPKALILGSGGAARAASYALEALSIPHLLASRSIHGPGFISYGELSATVMDEYRLIVNATPLGTFPNVLEAPCIPYEKLTPGHFLYDMVYNPPLTEFLRQGNSYGACIVNGAGMLEIQAAETWKLFPGLT